jgi:hypothetical protein
MRHGSVSNWRFEKWILLAFLAALALAVLNLRLAIPKVSAQGIGVPQGSAYPKSADNSLSVSSSGGSLPPGVIVFMDSGSCPSGFTEDDALAGAYLLGTKAANGDVGTTGGSNSYTPSGTVSQPTLAMNAYTPAGSVAWPSSTPAFAGTSGTVPAETITWPSSPPAFAGTAGTVPAETLSWPASAPVFTGTAASFTTGNDGSSGGKVAVVTQNSFTPAGTIAWPASAPTASSASFTPAGSVAWPASAPTNSTASFTPAGNVAWPSSAPGFSGSSATLSGTVSQPSFAGSAAIIQPAYIKVIACKAN